MSHEVESMFSVGARPWHGLGHVLAGHPSIAEAIILAGLNWTVEPRHLFTDVVPCGHLIKVPNHKAIVRQDNGAVLGVVGDDFTPLQNSDALGFFAPLIDEGLLVLETAGSLRDGKRVWVMAKVPGVPEVVAPGDIVDQYLLLCHGHDGSLALRVGFNAVRVVCANTLAAALEHGDGMAVLRHTAGMGEALAQFRTVVAAQIRHFRESADAWRLLASRKCDDATFTRYLLRVAAVARGLGDDEVRESMPTGKLGSRLVAAVAPLFTGGAGNDVAGIRGTWWAAYNAITQWLTHERGSSIGSPRDRAERRFEALHLGEGRRLSMRALMLAIEGAEASGGATVLALPPGDDVVIPTTIPANATDGTAM